MEAREMAERREPPIRVRALAPVASVASASDDAPASADATDAPEVAEVERDVAALLERGIAGAEAEGGDVESLTRYLRSTTVAPFPTAERERQLAKVIQDTSHSAATRRAAVDELVTGHLRWVVALAKRFRGSAVVRDGGAANAHRHAHTLQLEDFIAAGNEGLLKAAWRYDGSHRFTTYCTAWVWRGMQQAAEEIGEPTWFPWYLWPSVQRLRKVWPLREQWTEEELVAETGVPAQRVRAIMTWLKPVLFLGMSIKRGEDDSGHWADWIAEEGSDPLEILAGAGQDAGLVLRYLLDPARVAELRGGPQDGHPRVVPANDASRELTWRERRVLAVRYRLRLPLNWLLPNAEEREHMPPQDFERVYWETLRWLGEVAREREAETYADGDPRPPLNLEEAARFVGVSRERVRQIEQHALAKLRELAERLSVTPEEVL